VSAETKQSDQADTGSAPQQDESVSHVMERPKRAGIYTMTAQEGFDAAQLVKAAFARKTVGKRTPRMLQVIEPDGPSTAGGKRARQTIRLAPVAGDTFPVMCGFLDVAQRVVELRSYETLVQQYEARFGVPCDITSEEYATLCRELQMVLTPFRYAFKLESEQHAAAAHRAARLTASQRTGESAARIKLVALVLTALVVLVAASVALVIMR
jgi:hypothetical protein